MPSVKEDMKERLPDVAVALVNYIRLTSRMCVLDRDTLFDVTAKAIEATPPEERFVSFDTSVYVARHAGVIIGLLVMDVDGFREFMGQAIETEIYLDGLPGDKRTVARGKLVERDFERDRYAVMGLCQFSNEAFSQLFGLATKSLSDLNGTKFTKYVDEAFKSYGPDDAKLVGIILSNFLYLVRALNNNRSFRDGFSERIRSVMLRYGVSID